MRATSTLLVLALAACVSSSAVNEPSEALRGCWIERRGADTITMRWFPDENGHEWKGDMLNYHPGTEPTHTIFRVTPTGGDEGGPGWAACEIDDGQAHGPPCKGLYFRVGHMSGEGAEWMELHASQERLRFVYKTSGQTLTLFDGARDGCD